MSQARLSIANQTDICAGATHINANRVRVPGELGHSTSTNGACRRTGESEMYRQPGGDLRATDAAIGLHNQQRTLNLCCCPR